jgi:raffinose/stachyose/melibiose transport system substrate-binding protein
MAQTGEMVGLWYNKAMLEELGVEPPTTPADLESALSTAKDAGMVPIQFGNKEQWPGIHNFGFIQNQHVPRDEIRTLGFGQAGSSWDTPGNEQAAQTFADWSQSGYFTEGFAGFDYDPAWQAFAEGESPFLIAGTWLLADLSAAMGDDLGFMLPPAGDGGEVAVTGGTGLPFAITENSENADAAAAYIDFLTSPEAMTILAEAGELPVVDAEEQEVEGPVAEVFDAWATANESDALVPYLDYATPDFPELLGGEIQQLGAGDVSAGEFVGSLQEEYASFTEGR